jgi:hypothetical protein
VAILALATLRDQRPPAADEDKDKATVSTSGDARPHTAGG